MIRKLCLILFVAISQQLTSAWNRVGHDAVAYIAECHLTPRAKANIERYLDGRSIVYYASWLDLVRMTPEYGHTYKWHGSTVTPECRYIRRKSGNKDAVIASDMTIEKLRDHRNMTDSAVAVDIKILIHIIADMHCPSHVSFTDHPQGNFRFRLENDEHLFHNYWDGAPDMCHKWYYTDYQYQLDRYSQSQIDKMSCGTPLDWTEETAATCREIYDWIKPDEQLDRAQSYDLVLKSGELVDIQIIKAGYRLARLLNEFFDY
ncbi:MAG: S1/P1 nuclease [Muribaculaceae bacterium]|nr:S1/P1 nuclease [Muribaculaceae bacterium]